MSQTENLVTIEGLSFRRGAHVIFDQIDLEIPKGLVTAIMGPSGCGKTTLLRMIGGQLKPDTGRVWVEGENVPTLNRSDLFRVRRKMGMLFQSGALFTDLSVAENVAFPLRVHTSMPEALIQTLVMLKLEAVGLRGAEHLMPAELSGGMARRAALARAIALDPQIIMYDEPFAGQDPIVMGVLVTLIRTLRESLNLTSIIVSHDVEETLSIADRIYVLADGKVIGQGSPEELRHSTSGFVQQFLRGESDGPVRFRYPAGTMQEQLLRSRLHA